VNELHASPQRSVLVVDDQGPIRRLVATVLSDAGYSVQQAENGRQALEQMKQNGFDLLITDILMPETDGIELINYLRKSSPATKIIAVSGAEAFYLRIAQNLGADLVLLKPFRIEDLLTSVRSLA
jgi:CheY-like chemotaxis protein